MKTVLCDLDGVIVDLLPTWLHQYGLESGQWLHPDAIRTYDFQGYVSDVQAFEDCLESALEAAMPIPGSREAFVWLTDNFDVKLLTYCHPCAPNAHRVKTQWMNRWYPWFNCGDNMITAKSKHLVRGNYFIDDSSDNVEAWLGTNTSSEVMAFTYAAPYNNPDESYQWWEIVRELKRLEGL